MAELLPSERIRPCLLDRLTDNAPQRRKEDREQRVISLRKYREAVLRDLSWLLNSGNRDHSGDFKGFPEVERSVLNFGVPDVCGAVISSVDPADLARRIAKAIEVFEPRVISATLHIVPAKAEEASTANTICFEIKGELWAQPFNEILLIKTSVNLETGNFSFKESQ